MSTSLSEPQQYKQPSRKGKKAWRKNVDISKVHEGLESVRDEIIRTGGVIAEKSSTELFAIDTQGSEEIRQKIPKTLKQLKADQIIAQRSAVPAVDTRKRIAINGVTNGIRDSSPKRRKVNRISHRELEKLKRRAYGGESAQEKVITAGKTPVDDLWEDNGVNGDAKFSFLSRERPKVAPKTLREAPVSLLESGKAMPAVSKPNPGISYNPKFDEYEKLVREEGDKEMLLERKRIEEAKDESEKQARIEAARTEAEADKSEYYTEDESIWEGIESDNEGLQELKKKRPGRKTPAERNKIKRKKAAEREAKHQAKMAERGRRGLQPDVDAASLVVTPEIEADKQLAVAFPDSSDDEIDDRKLRRRKLGTIPVPEKPLEIVLADELQDSLRLLKPEGNLLKERFRNYLVGGKVETRRPGFQAKKAKRMTTEKWTYKDFTVPT